MTRAANSGARDPAGLVVLARDECLRLLASVSMGRLVFTEHALPAIQPVEHVVHDGAVVIRSGQDPKLAAAADGAVVAFEVDEFDAVGRTGWSVTAVGPAAIVTDPDTVTALTTLWPEQSPPDGHDCFLSIEIVNVSGRRVDAASP